MERLWNRSAVLALVTAVASFAFGRACFSSAAIYGRGIMFRVSIVLLSLFGLAIVQPAMAASLAAKKPSQIVTLDCSTGASGCSLNNATRIDGNGVATSGFTVPPGEVFVITSITLKSCGGTPGNFGLVDFGISGASIFAVYRQYGIACFSSEPKEFPTGIVVRDPSQFFISGTDEPGGEINGFLTKDN